MSRRERILSGLALNVSLGAEIGPLTSPLVERSKGRVLYVDHASTEALRTKYQSDPNTDISKIVDVDVVIKPQQTLREAWADLPKVNYVVASHVVEHVPNLISWFAGLRAILVAGGEVRLAVPDKRFCFDCLRQETRLSEVLAAHVIGSKVPSPHCILDFCINQTPAPDIHEAWRGKLPADLPRPFTITDGIRLAQDSADRGAYHDVHCWVFTPRSFAVLCRDLVELDLLSFACTRFHDTARNTLEFFVHMKETTDREFAARSWQDMADAADVTLGRAPPTRRRSLANRLRGAALEFLR